MRSQKVAVAVMYQHHHYQLSSAGRGRMGKGRTYAVMERTSHGVRRAEQAGEGGNSRHGGQMTNVNNLVMSLVSFI